jgi:hypothetical protein
MKKNILSFLSVTVVSALVVGFLHIAFMPLMVTGTALGKSTSVESIDEVLLLAPINQIAFSQGVYTPDIDVGAIGMTGPMADMIYAQGWLDVSEEPMIFEIPDFGDRYFTIPLIDRWNMVNGYIGTRSTGNRGGRYAVVHEDWEGDLPEGIERITASTKEINFILRVFVSGPDDFSAADALRRQVKLYPLSDVISE